MIFGSNILRIVKMSRAVKSGFKVFFILVIVCLLTLALYWQQANRLFKTITLFDEDVIVENFLHMDSIFNSVEIISDAEPHYFEQQPINLPKSYAYQGEYKQLDTFLKRSQTTALVVLHNDTLTHESYYKGSDANDKRISWSVAKSFLSAIFGVAVEKGAIKDIEDSVTDYVPELIGSGYEGVSIKNVLQMSSGVGFNEDYSKFSSDINRFGRTVALGGSFDAFAASLDNEREQGTFLHYVSIDTHVLGMVLRKATGETVADYFNQHLWSKIQPEASTYYTTDDEGEPMVLGGLNMRTRDYAKFGKLYMDNGKWKGEQVIPEAWVKSSITPDAAHLEPGKRDSSDLILGYGYQWWIPENADQEFMALGIYGQFIYVNQKAKVVIVKNSTNLRFMDNNFESARESVAVFRAIADANSTKTIASSH